MAISTLIKDVKVHVGDLVRVHYKIIESEKERIQIFDGIVIGIRGRQENRTFTVRKISTFNIGVEKIIPANSPWISKIEIKKTGSVRRAKLNYIRSQSLRQVSQISKETV